MKHSGCANWKPREIAKLKKAAINCSVTIYIRCIDISTGGAHVGIFANRNSDLAMQNASIARTAQAVSSKPSLTLPIQKPSVLQPPQAA
jgi:hypothetical protein